MPVAPKGTFDYFTFVAKAIKEGEWLVVFQAVGIPLIFIVLFVKFWNWCESRKK